jgi:hypothetical protein
MKAAVLLVLTLSAWPLPGAIQAQSASRFAASRNDDTPERLRARIAAEHDPVQRARLEIRLADMVLDQTCKVYADGDVEKGEASLKEMLALSEQAYNDLFSTKRDPRSKPAGFKDAELLMRQFARKLEDLRHTLSIDDRVPVEKALARVRDMHEDLLLGLMRVKKENPQ